MAPRRSVRSAKIVNNINYSNISLNDVLCPICRSILIQPVTLPCSHDFCFSCFEGTFANANLTCPLCRVRFSSWHRIAKKDNKVINLTLWDAVQNKFPQHVHNRLEGIEENLEEDAPIKITNPGEIRKEYKQQIKILEQENIKVKETEEKASAILIKKLKDQEEYEETVREEKLRLDEQVARQIAKEMGFVSEPSASKCIPKKRRPLDKFIKSTKSNVTEKKKELPQYFANIINKDVKPSKQKNLLNLAMEVTDSNDSIENECRYFKPIDHRNIPPSKTSTLLRVPAKIKTVETFIIGAPTGDTKFSFNSNASAFARFEMASPILGKAFADLSSLSMLTPKKRKTSENNLNDAKVKKLCLVETLRLYTRCVKNLKSPSKNASHTLKTRPSIRNFCVDLKKDCLPAPQTPKKIVKDFDGEPFLGFTVDEIEASQSLVNKPTKNNGAKKIKEKVVQEKNDLELAKKLQEEFNKERYSTRSSITCKSKLKKCRQITLDEIMSTTSKCK